MPGYKYGNRRSKKSPHTLRMEDYLSATLALPADSVNILTTVYQQLGVNDPTQLFPMDGNKDVQDCDAAVVAHAITVYNGLLGKSVIMASDDVKNLYFQLTGGDDNGLQATAVLNYWQANAIAGDQILTFVSVIPKNHQHIQQAIQIFGGVYLSFNVQQNAQDQFDKRQSWVPGPFTGKRHSVYGVAYDQTGLTVLTWGNTQQATWAWCDACVDEAYAILPPEALQFDVAAGFDLDQLKNDLLELET